MKVKIIILLYLIFFCLSNYAERYLAPSSWVDKNQLKFFLVVQMEKIISDLSFIQNNKIDTPVKLSKSKKTTSSIPLIVTISGNSTRVAAPGGSIVVPPVLKPAPVNTDSISYVPVGSVKNSNSIPARPDSVTLEYKDLSARMNQLLQNLRDEFSSVSQEFWDKHLLTIISDLEKHYFNTINMHNKRNSYSGYLSQTTTQQSLIAQVILDFLKKSILEQSANLSYAVDTIKVSA